MLMKKSLALIATVLVIAFSAPAFAANPFMDVPAGHWSYDAVAQLSARGVVSGYPDGAFKGAQVATRYEVASVVARALAKVDTEKASKADLEMLKKLVMEFKDELDALGVKVNKIDKRVAVLEDRLGGWKLNGILNFDARFANSDSGNSLWTDGTSDNQFTKERFRLYLSKQIDENTSFHSELRAGGYAAGSTHRGMGDIGQMAWAHAWVDTVLPYDVKLRLGRFTMDFEGMNGLYKDWDAMFGDTRGDGFQIVKAWDKISARFVVQRSTNMDGDFTPSYSGGHNLTFKNMLYAFNTDWKPNEKTFAGIQGHWLRGDGYTIVDEKTGAKVDEDGGLDMYSVYGGFNFTPAIQLKGIHYWQKMNYASHVGKEDPSNQTAWKLILDVKQDLLKFTSLWIEYSREDNGFVGNSGNYHGEPRYAVATYGRYGASVFGGRPGGASFATAYDFNTTSRYWFIQADQQWNAKWKTFVRYVNADWGMENSDNSTEWGAGITLQYTPAIAFNLSYHALDLGNNKDAVATGKDNVILFRTSIKF